MTIYTTSLTPRARVRVEAACTAERPGAALSSAASVVVAGSPLASIKQQAALGPACPVVRLSS